MFKRITLALLLAFASLSALAQAPANYTYVHGEMVTDAAGAPLNGVITFTPTNAAGQPIAFRIGGGGQALFRPVSVTVTNGVFHTNLADVNLSAPSYFCYSATAVDSVTGATVLGGIGYTCLQPNGANFDLDNYSPSSIPVQPITSGAWTGNYAINGNLIVSGQIQGLLNSTTVNAQVTNGVYNANNATGSDIGAKVNSAVAACSIDCTVFVPAGQYTQTTPIVLPMNFFGQLTLQLDDGAALIYSGTGCPITGSINTATPTVTNLRIRGGNLFGTAAATCGIHIFPSNSVSISGMLINGFSAGQGIWIDGANAVNIFDNHIYGNQVGVYATNTHCNSATPVFCSPATVGSVNTPNAVWIHDNVITANGNWGIQFYEPFTSASTGPLSDIIADNDLELNGNVGGSAFGAINVGRSTGLVIRGNYFEGSPREVVLGFPSSPGLFFGSLGPVVRDNYFTELNTTPYEIELQDTTDAVIEGNSTLGSSIQTSGACFVNATQTAGTYYGKNHVITSAAGSTGTVAPLCEGGVQVQRFTSTSSYSLLNTQYLSFLAYQNFAITTAASDTAGAQFVLAGQPCHAEAAGASAGAVANAQALIASTYVVGAAGSFTIYHPTGHPGYQYNIFCTGTPN